MEGNYCLYTHMRSRSHNTHTQHYIWNWLKHLHFHGNEVTLLLKDKELVPKADVLFTLTVFTQLRELDDKCVFANFDLFNSFQKIRPGKRENRRGVWDASNISNRLFLTSDILRLDCEFNTFFLSFLKLNYNVSSYFDTWSNHSDQG